MKGLVSSSCGFVLQLTKLANKMPTKEVNRQSFPTIKEHIRGAQINYHYELHEKCTISVSKWLHYFLL